MKLTLITAFVATPETGRVPTRVTFSLTPALTSKRCLSNICSGSIIPLGSNYLQEDGGSSVLCQKCLDELFKGAGVRIAGIQLE